MKQLIPALIPMHHHWHSVVSHPDVLVNVRRTLVSLIAIRALEPRLLSAVVLHVSLQGFLIGVAGVTYRTVIGHLAGVIERTVFVLDRAIPPSLPVFRARPRSG